MSRRHNASRRRGYASRQQEVRKLQRRRDAPGDGTALGRDVNGELSGRPLDAFEPSDAFEPYDAFDGVHLPPAGDGRTSGMPGGPA